MPNALKFLIVEDESLIAEMIRVMLLDLGYPDPFMALTQTKAEQLLQNEKIDFAILDINLRIGMEGIELAKLVNKKGIPFMFLTSYSDKKTITEAKVSKPGAYVIKPFSEEELFAGIEMSLMHAAVATEETITIKDGHRSILLKTDDILLIKADNIYIEIYTVSKRLLTRTPLSAFLDQITSDKFIRVHRSYAVNKNHIHSISKNSLEIAGQSVPISRSYRDAVHAHLMK